MSDHGGGQERVRNATNAPLSEMGAKSVISANDEYVIEKRQIPSL